MLKSAGKSSAVGLIAGFPLNWSKNRLYEKRLEKQHVIENTRRQPRSVVHRGREVLTSTIIVHNPRAVSENTEMTHRLRAASGKAPAGRLHGLDERRHLLWRDVREHAMTEIEDMSRPPAEVAQHGLGLRA